MARSIVCFRPAASALFLAALIAFPGCGREPARESGATAQRSVTADLGDSAGNRADRPTSDGERAERTRAERDYGPKRDDLDRFKGRYADPNRANEHHVWSVGEVCVGSGHLALAAMWGDVAPWRLASESGLVFTEPYPQPNYEPYRLVFRAAQDGSITGVLLSGPFEGALERLGDLPEGWEPEGEDCLDR